MIRRLNLNILLEVWLTQNQDLSPFELHAETKTNAAMVSNSLKEVSTSSVSLDNSGPILRKNILNPSAISAELVILVPLISSSLIVALSDLRRVTSLIVSHVLRGIPL